MILAVFCAVAFAGPKATPQTTLPAKASQATSSLQVQYDALIAEFRAAEAAGMDVSAIKEKLGSLSKQMETARGNNGRTLDRDCASCTPEDVDLGDVTHDAWAGFVSGNCGNEGKWVGRFNGVAGTVYHWDLCPSAPGAGSIVRARSRASNR
jgi:hypothetical protein